MSPVRLRVSCLSALAMVFMLVLVGCAHATVGYRHEELLGVEVVETFWWYETRQCDVRIIYAGNRYMWIPNVDPSFCGERRRQVERQEFGEVRFRP